VSYPHLGKPVHGDDSPRWGWAYAVRVIVGRIALALYRTRFLGTENVPAGGAIIAGNHVSYGDPVLLWCGSPRPTHFMAKSELFSGVIGWALARFWAFPVHRGSADRTAIQTATHLLQAGDLVGIFPEGTRIREATPEGLGEAHGGVAFIAMRADVPVVPVGIAGTDRIWPPGAKLPRFPKVTIMFCEPIDPAQFVEGSRKERVDAMTAEIMRRISEARDRAREV
jgi:1-acyl-sn-glycerol-3-phosphate acyltransferase